MSEKKSLFNLTSNAREIIESLLLNEGEVDEALEVKMATVELETKEKVDGYAVLIKALDPEAEYWKGQSKAFGKMQKVIENFQKRLKDNIKNHLVATDQTVTEGFDYKFTRSFSKPSVEVINEDEIPAKYFQEEVVFKLDKNLVRQDLDKGIQVPGVKDVQGYTLRIGLNSKLKGSSNARISKSTKRISGKTKATEGEPEGPQG